MSDEIYISGPIAYMSSSKTAVTFSNGHDSAGSFNIQKSTSPLIRTAQTALKVAYWGEDNRFPQNIENQMSYYGIGKSSLDWKARALYAGGIIPGRIVDYKDDGSEIFKALTLKDGKEIYDFLNQRSMFRFFLEYLQDWTWFNNCFPEAILSKDAKTITGFIHQESCDARYKQMNDKGEIDTVYLSKMWGSSKSQFAKFDPTKSVLGLMENPTQLTEIDNLFLKTIDCIDMYDHVGSLTKIAEKLNGTRGANEFKSAILPVNYPSVNKTYYQLAAWDGARLGGWIEIACKIPSLIKLFLKKGLKVQNHIEIPKSYFEEKYGKEAWLGFKEEKRTELKGTLLKDMDKFLTSDEATYSTFISFFDYDHINKVEFARIKFTPIESKYTIDKELITSSAADLQFLAAAQVHPTLSGAGAMANGAQRTGGSDQREAFLIYNAMLSLERQVVLEPIYLARNYNKWDADIVFRIRDTQLTTLDKNSGTKKVLS